MTQTDPQRSALLKLARHLHGIALDVIREDGEHAAMYFLVTRGQIEPNQFQRAERRPVGESRSAEMAEAVKSSGADAIVMVSEAWSARKDSVPLGGGAGDAPDATDVLIVAAVDRLGNHVAVETDLQRLDDGTTSVGEIREYGADYDVAVFNAVRRVWASTRQ
jgi:hypothetical protein